jgi:hypothetical protein
VPRPFCRVGLAAAFALLFVVWPVGDTTVLLVLAVAMDAAALLAARSVPAPVHEGIVVPVGAVRGAIELRRRTVPALRLRRPEGVIAAQLRWREASEAHRRLRGLAPAATALD